MTYTMKQLPEEMRPRERLLAQGEQVMSQAELIAILLGNGTQGKPVIELAQELLIRFGDLQHLSDASISELTEVQGMGPAKAVQLRAAFALANRFLQDQASPKAQVRTPLEAYRAFRPELEGKREERLALLLHDAKGCAIGVEVVSIGTLTKTLAHPREIFYPAIRNKAAAITLAHNHPSGDVTPSAEDFALTRRLISLSRVMEIPLLDHLILGRGEFTSIRDLWWEKGVSWL